MLNIIGSTIINVNLTPRARYIPLPTKKDRALAGEEITGQEEDLVILNDADQPELQSTHHNPSKIFLQASYFIIKFAENLGVFLLVMYYCKIPTDPTFRTFPLQLGLTIGFW